MALGWEIMGVPSQERRDVVPDQIELPMDPTRFPGGKAPNPEIAVQTGDHSLKELLVRLPGGRQDATIIITKAANQPVARGQRTQRTRVHVGSRNAGGRPDLPGHIARRRRPVPGRHPLQPPLEKEERLP